jgi:hypothetical protein
MQEQEPVIDKKTAEFLLVKLHTEGVLKKKYQKAILQTLLKKFEEAEQR